jgi:hypothetical protein
MSLVHRQEFHLTINKTLCLRKKVREEPRAYEPQIRESGEEELLNWDRGNLKHHCPHKRNRENQVTLTLNTRKYSPVMKVATALVLFSTANIYANFLFLPETRAIFILLFYVSPSLPQAFKIYRIKSQLHSLSMSSTDYLDKLCFVGKTKSCLSNKTDYRLFLNVIEIF